MSSGDNSETGNKARIPKGGKAKVTRTVNKAVKSKPGSKPARGKSGQDADLKLNLDAL